MWHTTIRGSPSAPQSIVRAGRHRGAAAADAVVRPDDRAVHGPGALAAAQRDVVLRPDDRADRRLPDDAPVRSPTNGAGSTMGRAGIGSAATLGLLLLLAGASVLRLRNGTQTA